MATQSDSHIRRIDRISSDLRAVLGPAGAAVRSLSLQSKATRVQQPAGINATCLARQAPHAHFLDTIEDGMADILYGGAWAGDSFGDDSDAFGRTSPPRTARWGRGRADTAHEAELYAAARAMATERATLTARAQAAAALELEKKIASAARQAQRVKIMSNLARSNTHANVNFDMMLQPTVIKAVATARVANVGGGGGGGGGGGRKPVAFEVSAGVEEEDSHVAVVVVEEERAFVPTRPGRPHAPPRAADVNTAFFTTHLPSPEKAQVESEKPVQQKQQHPRFPVTKSIHFIGVDATNTAMEDAATLAAADAAAAAADAAAAAISEIAHIPAPPFFYSNDAGGFPGMVVTVSVDTSAYDAAEALDAETDGIDASTDAALVGIDIADGRNGHSSSQGQLLSAALDDNYFAKPSSSAAALGGLLAAIDDGYFAAPREDEPPPVQRYASPQKSPASSPAPALVAQRRFAVVPRRRTSSPSQQLHGHNNNAAATVTTIGVGSFSHTRGAARVSSDKLLSKIAGALPVAAPPQPKNSSSMPPLSHTSLWPGDLRRSDASRDVAHGFSQSHAATAAATVTPWVALEGSPLGWDRVPKPLPTRQMPARLRAVESKIGDLVRGAREAARSARRATGGGGSVFVDEGTAVPTAGVVVSSSRPTMRRPSHTAAAAAASANMQWSSQQQHTSSTTDNDNNINKWQRLTFAGLPATDLPTLLAATREAWERNHSFGGQKSVAWSPGAGGGGEVAEAIVEMQSSGGLNPSVDAGIDCMFC
jgi:hypothetical protein